MEEKSFRVTIELEVTAQNEKEALKFTVNDINELFLDGSLDADIIELGE